MNYFEKLKSIVTIDCHSRLSSSSSKPSLSSSSRIVALDSPLSHLINQFDFNHFYPLKTLRQSSLLSTKKYWLIKNSSDPSINNKINCREHRKISDLKFDHPNYLHYRMIKIELNYHKWNFSCRELLQEFLLAFESKANLFERNKNSI
ncbi:serpin SMSB4 variant [Sarcoptes scabiei]|nr:serpin SMSB4 variant [Sarcoptes scabiei]